MIDLLKRLLDLVLRFLDWKKSTKASRDRDAIRKAVAEHDAKALNSLIQSRKDNARETD